jgi:hypothetical protein
MATFARPLSQDDEEALVGIDQGFARAIGLEPFLSRSSLHFYIRTGHSFVAMREGQVTGFVLAQAIWNGTRPIVYINRLAVLDLSDHESREALLEATIKSAYDAAVYDLWVQHPQNDSSGLQSLEKKLCKPREIRIFERILGSRGQKLEIRD